MTDAINTILKLLTRSLQQTRQSYAILKLLTLHSKQQTRQSYAISKLLTPWFKSLSLPPPLNSPPEKNQLRLLRRRHQSIQQQWRKYYHHHQQEQQSLSRRQSIQQQKMINVEITDYRLQHQYQQLQLQPKRQNGQRIYKWLPIKVWAIVGSSKNHLKNLVYANVQCTSSYTNNDGSENNKITDFKVFPPQISFPPSPLSLITTRKEWVLNNI